MDTGRSLVEFFLISRQLLRLADMNLLFSLTRATVGLGLVSLLMTGCETTSPSEGGNRDADEFPPPVAMLEGTVTYRERMLVPPTSTVTVQLLDVSRMDVLATEIASMTMTAEGAPPYAFSLPYDPRDIAEGMTYTVSARIENEGRLLFVTDTHTPPDFTSDEPMEIVLKRIGSKATAPLPPNDPSLKPDASLTNTYWKFVRLNGEPVQAFQREPHFVLQTDGLARGHLGCNSFSGGYESGDELLSFKGLRTTLMACPEGMEQEQALSQALGKVVRAKIKGDTLMLSDGEHNGLIYCEAVYLP